MQELTIKEFIEELITLTGLEQNEIADKMYLTQSSVWNFRKVGNPNLRIIQDLAGVILDTKGLALHILIGEDKIRFQDFDYKMFHFTYGNGMSVLELKETAAMIGVNHNTLRTRLSRSSCSMKNLAEHLAGIGYEMIFELNGIKYNLTWK